MRNLSYDFANEVFVVTGGSRGIGKAVTMALARAGASVAFTYLRDEAAAAAVIAELGGAGAKVTGLRHDVREGLAAEALVERVEAELGPLTGLVNNAGVRRDRALFQMAPEEWEDVLATNLSGSFYLARAVVRRLVGRERGKIVNVSSVSGLVGIEGQANYAASKAGLVALTRCLAREVGRFNIQVNAVAPGFIRTDMTEGLSDAVEREHLKRVPARRFGDPAEIASAVLFLLSDASDYVTGETLVIDGGLSS